MWTVTTQIIGLHTNMSTSPSGFLRIWSGDRIYHINITSWICPQLVGLVIWLVHVFVFIKFDILFFLRFLVSWVKCDIKVKASGFAGLHSSNELRRFHWLVGSSQAFKPQTVWLFAVGVSSCLQTTNAFVWNVVSNSHRLSNVNLEVFLKENN